MPPWCRRCSTPAAFSIWRPRARCSWPRGSVCRRSAASIRIRSSATRTSAMRCTSACARSSPTIRMRCASSPPYADQAELLLRVSFRSPGAVCDLSRKFGCDPEAGAGAGAPGEGARHRGARACRSTWARRPPIRPSTSRRSAPAAGCSTEARREKLGAFDTLDIGGGFPDRLPAAGGGYPPFLRADPRGARASCRSACA